MTNQHPHQLSKSRYMAGLQCLKRLYLEVHHRELADPVAPSQQAVFDTGNVVGELARQRFLGGTLLGEQYYEQEKAESSTRALLSDFLVPALYEAAFSFEGIRTRVDVLARADDGQGFDLIEVKSTTGFKQREHLPDVAIQLHVVEGNGVPIRRAYLMHIDNTYVYEGGEHDLSRLFALEDVTDSARQYLADVASDKLAEIWESLEQRETLDIETGRHCTSPYRCPFYGHCHADEPEHPITELPGPKQQLVQRLKAHDIRDIGSIPSDETGLSDVQRRVRDSVVTGKQYISPDLGERLLEIKFPASFLDFETVAPAIPIFVGTRPFQHIPFQWSLHVRGTAGSLAHSEFLHEGSGDPRESFVPSLLEGIPNTGSIVVYSGYEERILRQLAAAYPQYNTQLLALTERLVDLLLIVRDNYYHPEFHGSFSIKSVAPVLAPELSYDELDVADGLAASAAYQRLLTGDVPHEESANIRESLLTYCARDTEAMVRVYEALLKDAGGTDRQS